MSKIILPVFRLSFPNLFTPKADMNATLKYSLNALWTKDTDLTVVRDAAKAAAFEKWGDKLPKGLVSPFKNGDEKEYDGYAGHIYINAWSKNKPGLVDESVQAIMDQSVLYAGCYCRASVNAFAYETKNKEGHVIKTGVGFGLMNVQKVKDGEPFGNRSTPEDDFEAVAKAQSAPGTPGKSSAAAAAESGDGWL